MLQDRLRRLKGRDSELGPHIGSLGQDIKLIGGIALRRGHPAASQV